ncbi:MAG TPA: globin [Acidimicrobiales bacterium]|nr:globin [Acidimicrobiales bacterium]
MDESLYDQVGGEGFFTRLVEHFYERVALDRTLRAMYPEDLTEPRRHLTLFLVQYWGGPRTYEQERGHPRLRMRHVPFRVTKSARDAWLVAMSDALDQLKGELSAVQYEELLSYFTMTANQLRNV